MADGSGRVSRYDLWKWGAMMKSMGVVALSVVLLGVAGVALVSNSLDRGAAEQALERHAVLVTGSTNRLAPTENEASSEGAALEGVIPEATAPRENAESEEVADEATLSGAAAETSNEALVANVAPSDLLSIQRAVDRVEISGAVARVEDTDELVAAAHQAFPTFEIVTNLVQEANVAADNLQMGRVAMVALSRLAEGKAEISGGAITVTGRALYSQMPDVLAAWLEEQMPEGWRVSLDIDAPERVAANAGAQCQQQIVGRLSEEQIGFAVAAATLKPEAEPLLDDLAAILGECADVAIEVAGHTDSDGSEGANRRLSQERAAAVRQALAERGVEAERLSAVGYGQAQPIAPNDTPDNKARNRRIELIVVD
jgi:outer membrane protein OmpA-like peptidoglycan-associated protein